MKRLITPVLLLCVLIWGCAKEQSREGSAPPATAYLELRFAHQVSGEALRLGATYQNSFGEPFTVGKFKYYISNIALFTGAEGEPIPDTYFLVDESRDSSKTIRIPIQPGSYNQLNLLLGVDSTRNVSGAQTGALDPANDMFWTWNTGYIMTKLEGSSPLSTQPNNRIQYHVGGFAGVYSALRTIETGFFNPIEIKTGQTLVVSLSADVQRWFDGVHELPITRQSVAMTPGALASQYADNGAAMFSITDARVQ